AHPGRPARARWRDRERPDDRRQRWPDRLRRLRLQRPSRFRNGHPHRVSRRGGLARADRHDGPGQLRPTVARDRQRRTLRAPASMASWPGRTTQIVTLGNASVAQRQWAELRSLIAGTTSINGGWGVSGFVRNLDLPNDAAEIGMTPIMNENFPLNDSDGTR